MAPSPAPALAEREFRCRALHRREREPPVGWIGAPVLVSAIREIENNGPRRDRRRRNVGAKRKPRPRRTEPCHHATGCVEPVGGTARQRNRIDRTDKAHRIECVRSDGTRCAAAYIDRRGHGPIRENDGHAAARRVILGLPDSEPVDIGEEIALARPRHRWQPYPAPRGAKREAR